MVKNVLLGYKKYLDPKWKFFILKVVIDIWNESMEKVIGRRVNYKWPALEEAREFLKDSK